MKEIQLSRFGKNKGKFIALVDDEDFESINQYKWFVMKSRTTIYAARNVRVGGKRTNLRMHWEIMGGKGVDHKDHNGLNNQKSNLRFCTASENLMNRRKWKNTSSIYKGVCFNKLARKWQANIQTNGKLIHIGLFVSEVDAARAYNEKAIEFFGEFANLNNII